MKKINTLFLLFITCVCVSAQDFCTHFLETYEDDHTDFTIVNITPSMLKMITQMDITVNDAELNSLLLGINGFRIVTSENNSKSYYNSAKNLLLKQQYEELVSVDKSTKNVRIFTKNTKDNVSSEVIMLVLEKGKMTLVDIIGKINLNQLASLSTLMNAVEQQ